MKRLQEKCVFVPTDKASNNISVVCKQFYIKTMLNELKVFDDDHNMNTNTYEKVKEFSQVDIDEEITVKKQMTPELKIDEHIKKCRIGRLMWTAIKNICRLCTGYQKCIKSQANKGASLHLDVTPQNNYLQQLPNA